MEKYSDRLKEMLASMPCPPANWLDVEGWEIYWQNTIANIIPGEFDFNITPTIEIMMLANQLPEMRDKGVKEILLIGNGISQLPRALAHAGLSVTALDISLNATQFAQNYPFSDAELTFFFQNNTENNYRPNGKASFVCGDLFNQNTLPGPFDYIICSSSIQGFLGDGIKRAVTALDARLGSEGIIFLSVVNDLGTLQEIAGLFRAIGYHVNNDPEPEKFNKRLRAVLETG